ncbi:hypothetical protein [Hyphomicrobium sp.]|uniref:hypothetical protein n=1 Tax=Hyphomicrobium sp. TaxID=82 RepID=UPI001DC09F0E|nr:hypothetical protein [Hyphomicrobium sp.]MBY0560007.1 hypothetical protein [Hyphomicrobium sp.]
MSVKLTRRAVVQAQIESAYGVPETLGVDDGLLVAEPEYTINPTTLERNIATPDLSPEAVVLGRKLASMTFQTELRGNGKATGNAADAPIIARLFRACGYSMTEVKSPEVHGPFQIGQHGTVVDWAVASGTAATAVLTFTAQPDDAATVEVAGKTYTFQMALTNVAGNVLIGAALADTIQNLLNAINGAGMPGTAYAAATVKHALVSATATATALTVTAVSPGSAGNALTVASSGTDAVWGATTLAGGTNVASNTDFIGYAIEVVTGGASGDAEVQVVVAASPRQAAHTYGPFVVTSGQPVTVDNGLELTPTFTGDLVVGERWSFWLLPIGLRLDPVSDNFESVTLAMNKDGVLHTMPGAFGTFEITAEAGQYASINWTFTGTWVDPIDAPLAVPNYEKTLPAQVELARLRIDNFYAIVAKFTYDQANEINVRPDVSSAEGYIGTRITSRAPKGGIDPEADSVANHDFWGRLGAAKRMPFQMRVGKNAGNIVWMVAPSTQYTGLTYQDRDGILSYDAELKFSRYNGNDEFMLFFM